MGEGTGSARGRIPKIWIRQISAKRKVIWKEDRWLLLSVIHCISLSGVLKTNVRNYVIRNIKGSLVVNCKWTCGKSWDNSWIKWKRFSYSWLFKLTNIYLIISFFSSAINSGPTVTSPESGQRCLEEKSTMYWFISTQSEIGRKNCRKPVVETDSKASWVIGKIMVCREWHVLILFLSSCLWSEVRANFAVYFAHYEAFQEWIFPLKESLYFFLSLKFWMANLLRSETK